ncbi:hypothetical protein L5515_011076 [Caenorhabditis briggsae]|uniref:Uncharacterized protein n=2 Tax=Caenorhabditis briggsae TaxID=6238 RepID=A0AAE9JEZ7_CAEBR|nr:hypothetical protein L5515_011076 [Caenorhabditis briggsae]
MYFKKFYEDSKILDAYFTRGNCSKSDFYHFNDTEFVNCHWTRPTVSIPVYSCRKASFVACENVIPPPKTTTKPIPTTSEKIQRTKDKNVTVVPEVSHDFQEDVRPTEPSYFHVEFLDEHIMFFVTLSGFSVALLVASIVLQTMKMWQNRKLKIPSHSLSLFLLSTAPLCSLSSTTNPLHHMTYSSTLSKIVNVCIPEIQTDFFLWTITDALSIEQSDTSSTDSLLKISSIEILSSALKNPKISDQVEEILKSNPLELYNIHYIEKHPMLLSTALNLSFPEKTGVLGVEIRNTICQLTSGDRVLATVSNTDFEWPTYFINFAYYKKLTDFQVSVMESNIETKSEKCKRFIKHLRKQKDPTINSSSCTFECYTRREFYYSGAYGSHVFFNRISSRSDGICEHERVV